MHAFMCSSSCHIAPVSHIPDMLPKLPIPELRARSREAILQNSEGGSACGVWPASVPLCSCSDVCHHSKFTWYIIWKLFWCRFCPLLTSWQTVWSSFVTLGWL
jgi:hypothetical protein